jgi:S-adenosylmethionine decarboxylase
MMGPLMTTPTFFEGPEKKLAVVVAPGSPGLRSLGDVAWRTVVEAAGAKILSVLRNERCDAYLLSESSLFVFDDWFLFITCGETALVNAIPEILRLVPEESIAFLMYERKSEHFPERQLTTFSEDAQRLHAILPGRALRLGEEHGRYIQLFHTTQPNAPRSAVPTLEVLMYVIDEDVGAQFTHERSVRSKSTAAQSGIETILPGFETSEHVFEPCGYSCNALKGDEYYTVHVTPGATGSYVSFETNHDFRGRASRFARPIVELFRPRAFDVVTFAPEPEPQLRIPGYLLGDHVVDQLSGSQLSYFQYSAAPSGSRPARELKL